MRNSKFPRLCRPCVLGMSRMRFKGVLHPRIMLFRSCASCIFGLWAMERFGGSGCVLFLDHIVCVAICSRSAADLALVGMCMWAMYSFMSGSKMLYQLNGRKQRNPAAAPEFPGKFPGKFPLEMRPPWISRELGCAPREPPGEFPGKRLPQPKKGGAGGAHGRFLPFCAVALFHLGSDCRSRGVMMECALWVFLSFCAMAWCLITLFNTELVLAHSSMSQCHLHVSGFHDTILSFPK